MVEHEAQSASRSPRGREIPDPAATLVVRATPDSGLLSRLAATLNVYDVRTFLFRSQQPDAEVHVEVAVAGDPLKVDLAAARIRRIVGVLDVERRPTRSGSSVLDHDD